MDLDFVDNPWKLSAVLQIADVEDLDILVDYLTDKGVGRVSMAEDVCKRLVSCKRVGAYDENDRNIIGKEIRLFGGNSFANLLRGGDAIEYRELASDVAERLKARTAIGGSVPSIEEAILRKVLANAFERMSDAQRLEALEELDAQSLSGLDAGALVGALSGPKFGKYLTYTIARVATDSMAKAVLGRGLKLVAGRAMRRLAAASVGGPVGWTLAGVSALASPAFRVTLPCVVQVAYIRQKALRRLQINECPSCDAANDIGAVLCAVCRATMPEKLPVLVGNASTTSVGSEGKAKPPYDLERKIREFNMSRSVRSIKPIKYKKSR
jgi:uncharacterized protein YaaW (UPF0174 family)